MKRIIATTAMTLMLSTSAFAAAHTTALQPYSVEQQGDIYASEFIGMRVYAAEKDFDSFNAETMLEADAEQEWDDIGEINDVILSRDGQVKAVIIGVGGFIGIGEKDVAVEMSSIKMVSEKDDPDDFFLVVNTNKQGLTDMETYARVAVTDREQEVETDVDVKKERVMSEEKTDADRMMDGERRMLMAPEVTREGYGVSSFEELTTEDLTGARVYGAKDEDVGEIDKLIVDDSGQITKAILGIGGFLGIGERKIAVTLDELSILRETDGSAFRVYIDASKEQLEAQPEYEG
uniref:PRC-barrel domain-containing protein n=1 Tax=Pararhizobium sp. IMCC3301 TaxID=3067904 RepID=UPI00274291BF|nr:PRC-barrel domain-containing protein [Pararhizobium sp. IMCC3301]